MELSRISPPLRWVLWIVVGLCVPTFLWANQPQSQDYTITQRSKRLYKKAAKSFEHGNFDKATVLFRKVYEESRIPSILYDIAQAETADKKFGRALEMYERYLLTEPNIPTQRKEEVYTRIGSLQNNVAHIQIISPPECNILINEFQRGTAPLAKPIPVSANVVQIVTVFCHKQQVYERAFTLEPGTMEQADIRKTAQEIMSKQAESVALKNQQNYSDTHSGKYTVEDLWLSNYRHGAKTFLFTGLLSASLTTVNFLIPKKYDGPYVSAVAWGISGAFVGTSIAFFVAANKIKERQKNGETIKLETSQFAHELKQSTDMYKLIAIELFIVGGVLAGFGTGYAIIEQYDEWAQITVAAGTMSLLAAIVPTIAYLKNKKKLSTLQYQKDVSITPLLLPIHNGAALAFGGTF